MSALNYYSPDWQTGETIQFAVGGGIVDGDINDPSKPGFFDKVGFATDFAPVSYTHLTLPTIYSV